MAVEPKLTLLSRGQLQAGSRGRESGGKLRGSFLFNCFLAWLYFKVGSYTTYEEGVEKYDLQGLV
jgi:hypothetical protein